MNPTVAHRLLNAPTAVWTAYQKEHPHWGIGFSQCLRANTVSPLAVINNLRKLNDCMADPDVQPLLCDWFSKHFVSRVDANANVDAAERVQKSLAKCVRGIQLQAILQGQGINVLPQLENLLALSGNPMSTQNIWKHWLLDAGDIYTTPRQTNEYFINGKRLGTQHNLKKTLSQYQKFLIDAMLAKPDTARELKNKLSYDVVTIINGSPLRTAHALLWAHARLDTALKYALAYDWANDKSSWSTSSNDIKLSPQKTRHWSAWALHAQTYLAVSGMPINGFNDIVKILTTCPTLQQSVDHFDTVDDTLFMIN